MCYPGVLEKKLRVNSAITIVKSRCKNILEAFNQPLINLNTS